MKKLIPATLLALAGSFLSAVYISMVQTSDIAPDESQISGAQLNKTGDFESPNRQW